MLDADVDALFEVPVADFLVDDDAHSGLGHVVDNTGFAVIHLVWHAFLDGTVGFDVDDVSNSSGNLAKAPIEDFRGDLKAGLVDTTYLY